MDRRSFFKKGLACSALGMAVIGSTPLVRFGIEKERIEKELRQISSDIRNLQARIIHSDRDQIGDLKIRLADLELKEISLHNSLHTQMNDQVDAQTILGIGGAFVLSYLSTRE